MTENSHQPTAGDHRSALHSPPETGLLVRSLGIPFVCAILLVLFTCAVLFRAGESSMEQRPVVAVSVVPLRFMVEQLAGGEVDVIVAVPPGASPATHAPSDAEMAGLLRAPRYFSVGVPMERGPWFESIAGGPAFVDLRVGLELRAIDGGHDRAHAHGHDDPHVWLSPRALGTMAGTIASSLQQLLPGEAEVIAGRLVDLRRELSELDAELSTLLAPHAGRAFLVYHPSWGYHADDHELVQLSVETAGQQPSDAELAELSALVADRRLRVLFVQPQIHGRSAERLASALGLTLVTIDPLHPDVPVNLRRVSEALVSSWSEGEP